MKKEKLVEDKEKIAHNALIEKEGKVAKLVESDGWAEAKAILFKKMAEVDSISTLAVGQLPDAQLLFQISLRHEVLRFITEWISTIEGTAAKHDVDTKALEPAKEEDYIARF